MSLDIIDVKPTFVHVMASCLITLANVDPVLCRHVASLGHIELIISNIFPDTTRYWN